MDVVGSVISDNCHIYTYMHAYYSTGRNSPVISLNSMCAISIKWMRNVGKK